MSHVIDWAVIAAVLAVAACVAWCLIAEIIGRRQRVPGVVRLIDLVATVAFLGCLVASLVGRP